MRTPVPPSPRSRPGVIAVLALLGALLALLLPAQAAHAANYQYWGYYQVTNGAWTFSQVGPDKSAPADGSIEGWRFAVDDGSGTNPRTPRALPTFAAVCDTTAAQSGQKRVAVVVDYGRAADGDGTTTPPQP
ncbi:MAG: SCO2322 family protein, partial [Actinomycetota bacterium]|nr:SCO2322 family protein [Actinomycetota bacterium]